MPITCATSPRTHTNKEGRAKSTITQLICDRRIPYLECVCARALTMPSPYGQVTTSAHRLPGETYRTRESSRKPPHRSAYPSLSLSLSDVCPSDDDYSLRDSSHPIAGDHIHCQRIWHSDQRLGRHGQQKTTYTLPCGPSAK